MFIRFASATVRRRILQGSAGCQHGLHGCFRFCFGCCRCCCCLSCSCRCCWHGTRLLATHSLCEVWLLGSASEWPRHRHRHRHRQHRRRQPHSKHLSTKSRWWWCSERTIRDDFHVAAGTGISESNASGDIPTLSILCADLFCCHVATLQFASAGLTQSSSRVPS